MARAARSTSASSPIASPTAAATTWPTPASAAPPATIPTDRWRPPPPLTTPSAAPATPPKRRRAPVRWPNKTAPAATCRKSNFRARTPASPTIRFASPAPEIPIRTKAAYHGDHHVNRINRRQFLLSSASGLALLKPAIAAPRPLFEEIPPDTSGIHWVHDNGASAEHYLPETMGPGCAFLDYDNDGWMDIYLVNSGPSDFFTPSKPLRN